MSYKIRIYRSAQKELAKIPENSRNRIICAISTLADDPRPHGCKKLQGRTGWRIRVNDFRIIYEIDDQVLNILVVHIGNRRDVYL